MFEYNISEGSVNLCFWALDEVLAEHDLLDYWRSLPEKERRETANRILTMAIATIKLMAVFDVKKE